MSSRYNPVRTNRTPWMDTLTLIVRVEVADADGYATVTEQSKDVTCTFSEGISRTEFYEGMKAGISLTATAEIWADDFGREPLCEFNNVRYKIIRAFETGRGTIELSLSEVIR